MADGLCLHQVPSIKKITPMAIVFPQVDLRCDRCRHPWRDHGTLGCRVAKIRWDSEAQASIVIDRCVCRWYIGELPPLDVKPCPHEIQDQAEQHSLRRTCVHCGEQV